MNKEVKKLVWVEKPIKGRDCPYYQKYEERYGKCTAPANSDRFCSADCASVMCPLPGWDYEESIDDRSN